MFKLYYYSIVLPCCIIVLLASNVVYIIGLYEDNYYSEAGTVVSTSESYPTFSTCSGM